MSSPFSLFRRNQKLLLAIFGVIIMFVFVIGGAIDQGLQSARSGATGERSVVVRWDGGSLNEAEMAASHDTHRLVVNFLNGVVLETLKKKGTPVAPGFVGDSQGNVFAPGITVADHEGVLIETRILADQARSMGMVVSDDAIYDFLENQLAVGLLSRGDLARILTETTRGRITDVQMFDALRDELLAENMRQMGRAALFTERLPIVPPSLAWDYHQRFNRQATVELLPVPVKPFLAEVTASPTDAELKELYEKHKEDLPFDASPTPGFRKHQRLAFDYLRGSLDDFVDREVASVTDEEIRAEYDKRVARGEFRVPAAPADSTNTPADESKKPADGNEGDDSTSTKPTDNSQPDKNGDENGDTPKPDAPAPVEPKPDEPSSDSPKPEEPKPEESKPEEPKPEEPPSDEPKPAADAPDEPKPEQPNSEEAKSDDPKPEQPSSDEDDSPSPESGDQSAVRLAQPLLVSFQEPAEKPADESDVASDSPESKPAEDAPEKPAVQDEPSDDKPTEDKPVNEPPSTETPAEEPPADDKPADDKPADDKPSEDKSADAAAGEEKKADETPDGEATAGASDDSTNATSTPAEPKIRPLEEVREEIARDLALPRAREKMDAALTNVEQAMNDYYNRHARWSIRKDLKDAGTEPKPVDLKKLAAENHLEAGEVPLSDPFQVGDYPLGKAVEFSFANNNFQQFSFAQLAYGSNVAIFKPARIRGGIDEQFVYRPIKQEEERTPEFEEIRDEVSATWKMAKAIELAKKEARKLADQAAKSGRPLAEVFDDRASDVIAPPPFTWLSIGSVPFGGGRPHLNVVDGVEFAGLEFMKEVFSLEPGETGVAVNQPQDFICVVRLVSYTPDEPALRDSFLEGQYGGLERTPGIYVAYEDRNVLLRGWYERLEKKLNVKWDRPAVSYGRR